jgi:hypothetical protein
LSFSRRFVHCFGVIIEADESAAQQRNYSIALGYTYVPFLRRLAVMYEQKERWMELCAQASKEQDPTKLMKLVEEINRLLELREQKLKPREIPKGD